MAAGVLGFLRAASEVTVADEDTTLSPQEMDLSHLRSNALG